MKLWNGRGMANRHSCIVILLMVMFLAPVPGRADDARLPEPRFPDIIALWQSRNLPAALELITGVERALAGGEVPVDLLVLKAAILRDLKLYEESEAYWNGAVLRQPALREVALEAIYRLRLARADLEGAESCLEEMTGVAGDWRDLAARRDAAGDTANAERLYRRALKAGLKGREADQARLTLASQALTRGDRGEAVELLDIVRRTSREPRLARAAAVYGILVGAPVGKIPTPLTEDEYARHARIQSERADYRDAIRLLEEWRAAWPDSERGDEIEAEIIDVLFRMRANEEGLARCLAFAERYPDSSHLAAVRYDELLFRQRFGQTEELIALGNRFWKQGEWGGIGVRRSVAMTVAAYLVSHGRVADGLDLYREVYRSGVGDETARDILWRVGIASLVDGQLDRSADNFRALLRRRPEGDSLPSALFWLAVVELQRGNTADAVHSLVRLRDEYTYTYYGMRATDLLAGLEQSAGDEIAALAATVAIQPAPAFPEIVLPKAVRTTPEYLAAETFACAGMAREAALSANRLLAKRSSDKAVALLTARAWARIGEHGRALRIVTDRFRVYVTRAATGVPGDLLPIVYPRPWFGEVKAAVRDRDIDPHLMMSLMRRESRFDRFARSWVGAIGLFQIMPYTARDLSPRLGLGALEPSDLYEPRINATIAAALAADLLRRFDQRLAPAVASYNAGEDRVSAWWRSTPDSEFHEALFVDTIPYKETRFFVREVLTNYHMYRTLYAKPAETNSGEEVGVDTNDR